MGMPPLDPHSSLQVPSSSGATGIIALIQRQREEDREQRPQNHITHTKNTQKMQGEVIPHKFLMRVVGFWTEL